MALGLEELGSLEDFERKPTTEEEMRKKREAERLPATNERLRQQIEQVSMALAERDAALVERDAALAEQDAALRAERALWMSTARAARKSMEAKAVRQDHLVRTLVDVESRLELLAKVGLRVEQWEAGPCT